MIAKTCHLPGFLYLCCVETLSQQDEQKIRNIAYTALPSDRMRIVRVTFGLNVTPFHYAYLGYCVGKNSVASKRFQLSYN